MQQLTLIYGVVSEGFFSRKFAEILRKLRGDLPKNNVFLRQERVRKVCGFRRNSRKVFCNDHFPNDPISDLLNDGRRVYFSLVVNVLPS